jgi:predicted kinase
MAKLYILCGIPGSGKSTWAERCDEVGVVYVSRDSIRFSMLQEGDQYTAPDGTVYTIGSFLAGHPNDAGYTAIAQHLISAL